MTTVADVQASIEASLTAADILSNDALAGVDRAIISAEQAANSLVSIGQSEYLDPAAVVPAEVTAPILPTADFSTEVKEAFDYAFSTFNQSLQTQILEFLTAFFPDIAAGVATGSDQWIIDTIANGRYVPVAVENALWNRARDREVSDSLRAEQAIVDAGASRGFSAPPGVVNYGVAVNQQESSKRLVAIDRDIAIKAFDVANENTKFAIEQAVQLRTAFVSAMGDFIKTAMLPPNNATEYAKLILDSKTGLYDSAVRLYSANIEEERMRTGVLLENNKHYLDRLGVEVKDFDTFATAAVNKARLQADTALKAADTLAAVAAAAQSTKNTMSSVSGGV